MQTQPTKPVLKLWDVFLDAEGNAAPARQPVATCYGYALRDAQLRAAQREFAATHRTPPAGARLFVACRAH